MLRQAGKPSSLMEPQGLLVQRSPGLRQAAIFSVQGGVFKIMFTKAYL
jgi:hypothetical protein